MAIKVSTPTLSATLAAAKKKATTKAPAPAKTYDFSGVGGLSKANYDWLSKGADSSYQSDIANNTQTLNNGLDDNKELRARYAANEQLAFHNLGYDPTAKAWNPADLTTAFGQDVNNQGYDFGARNALHSSEFANARQNLQTGYQKQADAMTTAGQQQDADLTKSDELLTQNSLADKTSAIQAALARYAASKQKVV